VIVAVAFEAIAVVVTVKVAEFDPARTVTEAGTDAAALFEARVTVVPPAGAIPVSVTVPVELATPPTTVVGLTETLESVAAVTVKLAVAVVEPVAPVMVAVAFEEIALVVAVNVPVDAPAAIEIEAGTVTAALFELKLTVTVAPVATGAYRVTVPVEVLPPATDVGLITNFWIIGGTTFTFAVDEPPP